MLPALPPTANIRHAHSLASPASPPQLTINLVALLIAVVAAISNGETPLNVLQLLWVNLIMDSLAALGECAGRRSL